MMCSIFNQFIVYAAKEPPFGSAAFDQVIGWVIGLSTGLFVVAASVCLIRIMVADDTSQVAEAKQDLKQALIAWLAMCLFGAITHTVFSLIGYMNY